MHCCKGRCFRTMSPKKCIYGCEERTTLFSFPKNPDLRKQWVQFIFPGHQRRCANVFVCSRHFANECFRNKAQFDAGFAQRIILKDGAVPSIKKPGHEPITQVEKVEETTVETRLCPLCQRSLKDSEALSFHLTKKHSVHPACLENLLISAPYAIRSGVTESSPEKINSTSQQKSSTKSCLSPVEQDASSQEHDTCDKSGVGNKGSGDGDTVRNDQSGAAADGSVSHPFKCHTCLEFFTHKSALSVHYNSATHIQRTRTEVRNDGDSASHILAYPYASTKPYQCDLCHVSYFYPFGLENHLKSVLHQSRTRKAGINGAISRTNAKTGIVVANLRGSTVANATQLHNAKPRNCAPHAEKVRIQPASSLPPNPAVSTQAMPTVLPFLTLAPNSVPHTLVPSVFPVPGTSTTHLIPQPQMLMPLIVNGLQTHGPTPDNPQQLLQQAVNMLGFSSTQHAKELHSSDSQSQLATPGVSSASQTPSKTIKSSDAAGVKVKIEIKEEPCDREVSQTDPCTADAISQGLKQENKCRWDGIENSRTTYTTICRIEGGDKQECNAKGVSLGENSKRHPPDINTMSTTEELQSSHVNRASLAKCNPSNANLVLTSSSTCSNLRSGPPVLTEFQWQVLWAFLESRKEVDSVVPPREDCEALGRVVGLTEDEVRKWLANTRLTKERHSADAGSYYERQESTEDDDDALTIDESSGLVLRSTTDFLSDEEGRDKPTTVNKKRKRATEKEESDEES